jgi:CheY-like chemotaxis protein
MGLGLAIVERACRLLGHDLTLTSAPGIGTCFRVTLPLHDGAALHPEQAAPRGWNAPRNLGAELVLLIENDADVLRALTTILEKWDLSVLAARSEAEAHDLVDEVGVAPDAIIADYQLDDDRLGTDAIASLRGRLGPIPACIVSANRSPELIAACGKLGLTLFPKPLEPARLAAFLANVEAST